MIEISFGKLLLLAIVALVVLGPEKLPGAARTAGALIRRMRNGWDSVRAEVEREIQAEEIRRTLRETAETARQAQDSVRDGIRGTAEQWQGEVKSAHDSVREVIADARITSTPQPAPDPNEHMLPLNKVPTPVDAAPEPETDVRNSTHDRG
ncbi:sec-independent protein translocase protein TatB [Luteibacter sp. Sphag1AF]|uniref:Sec-independent protein translocase protein TatB n=1 Tax=Luteibacter sp. Sphag1AF TaxID=2587031 RepID=UPI00160B43F4|nr:Sec-independent protein translocase protein TatB [Luteibacter sp. Sphag1AF]MBB3226184.1 sec-independent protein translocase protein TatB [Luteibacter sp. Sphag1AF]